MGLDGVRSVRRNLTPLPAPRDDGELVTRGIFARVRHPLLRKRDGDRIRLGAASG